MQLEKTLLLLFLWSLSCLSVSSQEVLSTLNFKFKNISVENGLSNTSVSSIVQDDYGFIWIGTRDGLNRFNSSGFKIFRANPLDSTSISDNWIRDLLVDREGVLWVATKNGLNKYDSRSGFQKFFHQADSTNTLTDNNIFKLYEDRAGNIWIATGNGLNRFDKKRQRFEQFYHQPQTAHSLSNNFVRAIHEDTKGHLWLVTKDAIDRFDVKKRIFKHYLVSETAVHTFSINEPATIIEDSEGRIWAGLSYGLWLYDSQADVFKQYQMNVGGSQKQIEERVRRIHEDNSGNLWIGTYKGLFVMNPEKGIFTHLVQDKLNPYSLKGNSIYAIFEDRAGDLWIGSWWGGLNYLDRNFDNFHHFNEVSGLSFSVVSSFVENDIGDFWIGTGGGGINYFDRSTKSFHVYKQDDANPNSLALNNVQDIAQHGTDKLIVGTHGKGLDVFWFQEKEPRFQHFMHRPEDESSISSNWITTVFVDSKNRIWTGSNNGGVNHFQLDKGIFIRYKEGGISISRVNAIYEDRQKNLWVGTDKGLGFIDETTREIDYTVAEKVNEHLLKDVLCIYQDPNNNFWLGTEGEGLVFFEDGFSNLKKFRQEEGLPNNVVYGILADEQEHLWLSTNNGLSKFEVNSQAFENYDVSDGLQSNEFTRDAYFKSSKGELLFGGVNGFNIFYPDEVKKNTDHPPVVITDLRVKKESFPIMAIAGKAVPTITLNHLQTPFSIDFVVLNYAQPGKNRLAYQLHGQDEDWIEIENSRSQTFSGIGAGTYLFKLKAASIEGEWNNDFAAFQIRILPPWWQTWWAYVIYLITLGSLVLWGRQQVIIRKKDKRALKTEKEEREKMESLNRLKLQFFTSVSHELRTPLTLIYGPLEKLKTGKDQLTLEQWDALQRIDVNAKRLLRHVNNILDFRKDEFGLLKLKAAEGNMVKFTKEVFLSFQEIAKNRNIKYKFKTQEEDIPLYFDRDKMEVILFNLFSNAFKFTPDGGRILFRIYRDLSSNAISLTIEDNGCGIDPKYMEYIFEPYFQIDNGRAQLDQLTKGSGIGLALTKRLVELHHGNIEVSASKSGGACFTIHFLLGSEHLAAEDLCADYQSSEDIDGYKTPEESAHLASLENGTLKKNLPTLLIVEDNLEVRSFIIDCLNNQYNILEAADGEEGYKRAMETLPDLIISDVMMPKMDGITMCSKLKTEFHTSHIPIILLTARTSLIYEKSGLETGADDYITKPFSPSLLLLRIRNLVETRKKLQQHFVRNLKTNPKEVTISSRDNQFLSDAVDCVEKHIRLDQFDASLFAEKMNCSESTLYKKLKAITGQSISEFTRTIRIKRAAQILEQDRSSISQVAYSVGFNDLKYFRQCFRKQFGQLPSEYARDFSVKDEM